MVCYHTVTRPLGDGPFQSQSNEKSNVAVIETTKAMQIFNKVALS